MQYVKQLNINKLNQSYAILSTFQIALRSSLQKGNLHDQKQFINLTP